MRRAERKLVIWVCLLFAVSSGCLGITAYSVYKQQAINTFTVGYNEIKIEEDFYPPEKLLPGLAIKKEVRVENTGPVPCYIRVMVQFTSSRMEQVSAIDFNLADWLRKGDYYYYKSPLQPGEKTANLFSKISISEDSAPAELAAFDILIYAEAKQAKGDLDAFITSYGGLITMLQCNNFLTSKKPSTP